MKVGVLGAGAVGAYVGGLVQARSGLEPPVVLVGRQRLVDQTALGAGAYTRPLLGSTLALCMG
jgi:ketopantoate reductase